VHDRLLSGVPEPKASPTLARYGPPPQAWYPVALQRDVRRRLKVRLFEHEIELVRSGADDIQVLGSQDYEIDVRLGLVWIRLKSDKDGVVPLLIEDEAGGPDFPMIACSEVVVDADYDQVVLGLVDPAHVPMVHTAWWWRSSDKRRIKTKHYTPSPFGFTAMAADAFASAPAYELVGSDRKVTIEFRLPSSRIERVRGGRIELLNITTVTPIGPDRVVLRNVIYSSVRPLKWIYPALSALGRAFLRQDADILTLLDAKASRGQRPLFVGPPDKPSAWYFQCKMALIRTAEGGGAFENPVRPSILQWRT